MEEMSFSSLFPVVMRGAQLSWQKGSAELAGTPVMIPNGNIAVRVSAGATVATAGNKIDSGLIVAAADRALYSAKEAGRNRVKWVIPE